MLARLKIRVRAAVGRLAGRQELLALAVRLDATERRLDALAGELSVNLATLRSLSADVEASKRISAVAAAAPPTSPAEIERPDGTGPLVSVVVPAHGEAPLLERALRSIAAQTYRRFECVVVNDGVSPRVAAAFEAVALDPRFRMIEIERAGVRAARNAGLLSSGGELIAFLDADNQWTSWHLASSVPLFTDEGVHATYAAMLIERAGGVVDARSQPYDRAALLQECFIDLNVLVHRRTLYELEGGFDERLERLVDWDYVARLTRTVDAVHLRHVGCIYDDRNFDRISTSRAIGPNWYTIREKWRGQPAAHRRVVWVGTPDRHETFPLGLAQIAGLRALGADVQRWAPGGSTTLRSAVEASAATDIVFATTNAAVRYISELEGLELSIKVWSHRPGVQLSRLEALASDTRVTLVVTPTLVASVPGAVGVPALFDPSELERWSTVERPRDVVAVALPERTRRCAEEVLAIAALCPALRFDLALPRATRNRRLLTVKHAAESMANVRIVSVAEGSGAAEVFRGAALSLHIEPPSGTEGSIASGEVLCAATAWGCVPVMRAGSEAGYELVGRVFTTVAEAAGALRSTQAWTDAEWRDQRRWALDAAWIGHAAPELLQKLLTR